MTDFAFVGKKRTGKSKHAVLVMRDYLKRGSRVATNIDLNLEPMFGPQSRHTYVRVPDLPTVADFEAIGKGIDNGYDEDNFGALVLDELGVWFNARDFTDKGRAGVLKWLVHSGKFCWDVYYLLHDVEQVDKQLRNTQVEYHVAVKRTDRWPIPGVTPLAKLVGLDIRFPKMHLGIFKHGVERESMVVDRKWYKAADIYKGYDTEQVFLDRDNPRACGMHSVLSAWHIKGRYLPKPPPYWLRFLMAIVGVDWTKPRSEARPALKPKLPLILTLQALPEQQRILHFKRLDSLGAFN